jgi:PAS domain S-box-containing protein
VADTTPDLLYVYDLSTRSNVYVNQSVRRTLGYDPEQLAGMGGSLLTNLVHPDDLNRIPFDAKQFAHLADGELWE